MNKRIESSGMPQVKNEIDYMVLLNHLWKHRKWVISAMIAGLVIGLFVAFLTPKTYKVSTTMLPQSESESSMGKISSLASLAGFDLDLSDLDSDLSPILYPQIVESAPFMLELMNKPFTFKKVDHPVSLYEYYMHIKKPSLFEYVRQFTVGLPSYLKSKIKGKGEILAVKNGGPIVVTEEQAMLMESLEGCVELSINKKEGYLTLTCYMTEPLLTAQVAEEALNLLQKYIVNFKTKKATEQLAFIEQRFAEKKADCIKAQERLASFRDRNWHVSTASALAEQERLQNDYDIANSVYSELAKSLEQSKIQVKRQTPAFAVIKPVVVPIQKDSPHRVKIILISIIFGLVIGVASVFINEYLIRLKKDKAVNDSSNTD